MRGSLLATLVVAASLAGCLQAIPEPNLPEGATAPQATLQADRTSVTDAAGDARERPPPGAFACPILGCGEAPVLAPEPVPFPDLVGIAIVGEALHHLVLDVAVAQLDEALTVLDRGDGFHRLADIATCLDTSRGELCLHTRASRSAAGASVASHLLRHGEGCGEWQVCAWQVDTEVLPGAPGAFRLHVPTARLTGAADALDIGGARATARVLTFEPGLPATHAAATVYLGEEHKHEHLGPLTFGQTVDLLEPQPLGPGLTVLAGAEPPLPGPDALDASGMDAGTPVVVSGPGASWGGDGVMDHGRYDLRAVRFAEDEEGLAVTFELGAWDGFPSNDLHIVVLFGTAGGEVYEVGVLKEGGEGYGYVGHCITYDCDGPYVATDVAHNHAGWQQRLAVDEEGGGADALTVKVPWAHLPTIGDGDRLTYLQAVTMYADLALYFGEYGDTTHGDVHKMSFMDFVEGARPYGFRHGLNEEHGAHGHAG